MKPHPIRSVTVVICTYNRANQLRSALESLGECRTPDGISTEVVVVDNASKDTTPDVVSAFQQKLALRSYYEPEPGLSRARNRAVKECPNSDLILFTDDDVRVAPGWISAFVSATQQDAKAQFFGGRVVPFFAGGRPSWLKNKALDLLDGLFVSYDLGAESRRIHEDDILPVGASMGFRRSCFEQENLFAEHLGVVGRHPARGEDTEFIQRLIAAGIPGLYVADATSEHDVDPERLTWTYAFRYGLASGESESSPAKCCSYLARGAWQLLHGRGDRARQCAIRAGMALGKRQP